LEVSHVQIAQGSFHHLGLRDAVLGALSCARCQSKCRRRPDGVA
jgi:hypothetical protein